MATNLSEYYRGLEAAAAACAAPDHTTGDGSGERVLAGAGDEAARAAAVHAATASLFSATSAAAERACRRGCAHCCHLPVGVAFGEALLLARAVASRVDLRALVASEAAATATMGWSALVGRPCPLLVGGACAVYEQRPLPCRALASRDAGACESALTGRATVPIDDEARWRGLGAAALLDAGLGRRELRSAVAALVARPDDARTAFLGANATRDPLLPSAG